MTHGENVAFAAPELVENSKETGRAVERNQYRLSIRLGVESPVVTNHLEARNALREIGGSVDQLAGLGAKGLQDSWRVIERSVAELGDARDAFVRGCVGLVGVDVT